MNIIKKYILGTIAAMSLSGLGVSCTQDEFGMLPENERSLKFTATVDGMVSRADDAGFWVTGDTIRVRISADESLDFYPWIGQYEPMPTAPFETQSKLWHGLSSKATLRPGIRF